MLTRRSLLGSDNIPEDLRDPFYIDQYEQEHIKPPVIKLLLSSELYCRVCSLILKGDQVAALQGHQSVIQALSRKGIYVMESDDTPVTDPDLSHAPIKMVSVLWWGGGGGGRVCHRPRLLLPRALVRHPGLSSRQPALRGADGGSVRPGGGARGCAAVSRAVCLEVPVTCGGRGKSSSPSALFLLTSPLCAGG